MQAAAVVHNIQMCLSETKYCKTVHVLPSSCACMNQSFKPRDVLCVRDVESFCSLYYFIC